MQCSHYNTALMWNAVFYESKHYFVLPSNE